MIISTTATVRLWNEKHVSQELPLDLTFVIDFPGARRTHKKEFIQIALQEARPFLGDKDRLSVLIFDEESINSSNELLFDFIPLTNTTKRNKNKVFSTLGEEFSTRRSNGTSQGLHTAIQFPIREEL